MIGNLKPYPEYKESGLSWLGQVPGHWDVRKPRHIGSLHKGVGGTKEDALSAGVPCVRYGELYTTHSYFVRRPKTFIHSDRAADYTPLQYGDVLFAASGESLEEIGKSAVSLIEGLAVCGGDVIILRPTVPVHAPFLGYVMDCRPSANQKATMGRGTTVKHIYPDELKHLLFPLPPVSEQAAIARFLDWANGRLERAIRTKRKVIALLNEQKQAIIHRAVTRGLDSSVPLKPSGIPWLGDIPQHWEVAALGRLCISRCDGPFGSGLKSAHYTDSGVRVIRLQNIGSGEFRARDGAFISAEHYATLGDHGVIEGDLLVAGLGDDKIPAGRACVAPPDLGPAMVKADCFRFRLSEGRVVTQFMAAQLSATAAGATACLSTGATRLRINLSSTASRSVAIPPVAEQRGILTSIGRAASPLISTISRLEREIELLREYRTRLVADVVTGKLDVREAAARLPDEAPLDAVEDAPDMSDESESADEEATA
ncbi:MAG: restriction endonuclease subunit S [bacterium]